MLHDTKSFTSFAVDDLDAARTFYGSTLGLEVKDNEMGTLELHLADRTPVMVYPKPDFEPATYTVLNFEVRDVEQAVDELTSKGVRMERYDRADMPQDERGISRDGDFAMAWFTDPAGNIIALLNS